MSYYSNLHVYTKTGSCAIAQFKPLMISCRAEPNECIYWRGGCGRNNEYRGKFKGQERSLSKLSLSWPEGGAQALNSTSCFRSLSVWNRWVGYITSGNNTTMAALRHSWMDGLSWFERVAVQWLSPWIKMAIYTYHPREEVQIAVSVIISQPLMGSNAHCSVLSWECPPADWKVPGSIPDRVKLMTL